MTDPDLFICRRCRAVTPRWNRYGRLPKYCLACTPTPAGRAHRQGGRRAVCPTHNTINNRASAHTQEETTQ